MVVLCLARKAGVGFWKPALDTPQFIESRESRELELSELNTSCLFKCTTLLRSTNPRPSPQLLHARRKKTTPIVSASLANPKMVPHSLPYPPFVNYLPANASSSSQSKDSSFTSLHLTSPHHPSLLETLSHLAHSTAHHHQPSTQSSSQTNAQPNQPSSSLRLPFEEIFIPAQHQPLNPEDEDDVVPDQHAAFGIQQAGRVMRGEQGRGEGWRDFGLEALVRRGPTGVGPGEGGEGGQGAGARNGTGVGIGTGAGASGARGGGLS